MFLISKLYSFCASHHLPDLPEGHKCKRPHGHNYQVVIVLGRESLDGVGFVVDYGEMDKKLGAKIDTVLDHRDLNEIFKWAPTAERLAEEIFLWAYGFWGGLVMEVRISETPKTWATYRPEAGR